MKRGNLFEESEVPAAGERFEVLARCGNVEVERIVSSAAPEPTRYVQRQDEWVALLAGEASLDVDGETVHLRPGDWILLPAGTPHSVVAATAGARWLAVHVHPAGGGSP